MPYDVETVFKIAILVVALIAIMWKFKYYVFFVGCYIFLLVLIKIYTIGTLCDFLSFLWMTFLMPYILWLYVSKE